MSKRRIVHKYSEVYLINEQAMHKRAGSFHPARLYMKINKRAGQNFSFISRMLVYQEFQSKQLLFCDQSYELLCQLCSRINLSGIWQKVWQDCNYLFDLSAGFFYGFAETLCTVIQNLEFHLVIDSQCYNLESLQVGSAKTSQS